MSDENPLLDFLLADLAWGKKPRDRLDAAMDEMDRQMRAVAFAPPAGDMPLLGLSAQIESADEAFAREIELAREVCEDAEVDALTQPVPTVTLPFGGDGGSRE